MSQIFFMIYDSSVLLNSMCDFDEIITVEEVMEEIRDRFSKLHIMPRNIKIFEPSEESVKVVLTAAEKTGDKGRLSLADIKLLALALERKDTIITDDYDIQNLAAFLGVRFAPFRQRGIKEVRIRGKAQRSAAGCER